MSKSEPIVRVLMAVYVSVLSVSCQAPKTKRTVSSAEFFSELLALSTTQGAESQLQLWVKYRHIDSDTVKSLDDIVRYSKDHYAYYVESIKLEEVGSENSQYLLPFLLPLKGNGEAAIHEFNRSAQKRFGGVFKAKPESVPVKVTIAIEEDSMKIAPLKGNVTLEKDSVAFAIHVMSEDSDRALEHLALQQKRIYGWFGSVDFRIKVEGSDGGVVTESESVLTFLYHSSDQNVDDYIKKNFGDRFVGQSWIEGEIYVAPEVPTEKVSSPDLQKIVLDSCSEPLKSDLMTGLYLNLINALVLPQDGKEFSFHEMIQMRK